MPTSTSTVNTTTATTARHRSGKQATTKTSTTSTLTGSITAFVVRAHLDQCIWANKAVARSVESRHLRSCCCLQDKDGVVTCLACHLSCLLQLGRVMKKHEPLALQNQQQQKQSNLGFGDEQRLFDSISLHPSGSPGCGTFEDSCQDLKCPKKQTFSASESERLCFERQH